MQARSYIYGYFIALEKRSYSLAGDCRSALQARSAPKHDQTPVGALLKRDTTPESMLPNRAALVSQPVRQAFLFLFIGKPLGIKPLN